MDKQYINERNDNETHKVISFFEEISRIPRKSGNEKAISDFLMNFAKKRNSLRRGYKKKTYH